MPLPNCLQFSVHKGTKPCFHCYSEHTIYLLPITDAVSKLLALIQFILSSISVPGVYLDHLEYNDSSLRTQTYNLLRSSLIISHAGPVRCPIPMQSEPPPLSFLQVLGLLLLFLYCMLGTVLDTFFCYFHSIPIFMELIQQYTHFGTGVIKIEYCV